MLIHCVRDGVHFFVTKAESAIPGLIEFCDLDWDDACMNFHKTKRTVVTASYDQVRRPLYTTSIERWRNYEKYIGELLFALGNGNS